MTVFLAATTGWHNHDGGRYRCSEYSVGKVKGNGSSSVGSVDLLVEEVEGGEFNESNGGQTGAGGSFGLADHQFLASSLIPYLVPTMRPSLPVAALVMMTYRHAAHGHYYGFHSTIRLSS